MSQIYSQSLSECPSSADDYCISVSMSGSVRTRNVLSYVDEFISECSEANNWSLSTLKTARVLKSHLSNFGKAESFEYFDKDGLDSFVSYLRYGCSLREASCRKQYKNLRWFLSWAIKKKYCAVETILGYAPRFRVVEKPVIFLTEGEFAALRSFRIPKEGSVVVLKNLRGRNYRVKVKDCASLELARDLFCFCAFTSLRYSDMAALKRPDIREGMIHMVMRKTGGSVQIELCPQALAILRKYSRRNYPGMKALPPMSNSRMNRLIKQVCELAGINTPVSEVFYKGGKRVEGVAPKWARITTHAARRTFVCFALSQGIPPHVVMKWTGHSDYASMKPYIDVAEKTRTDAMRALSRAWSAGTRP